ncbi:MAG: imidazole glycerol phosphate synthase, glutamine amidotransferase subunit [Deltaproteobacteria bacterium RBG_13_52_11]|nr:MAG: imidazole glycerol phosphate synthase, glutamine amidotransferase subunit [Deltaproteobacteria bacterium RBG_13_52_11]
MIAIVDYGMGNLRSVHKALEQVGLEARVTSDPREVANASEVVLPGVGAFKDCMRNLEEFNLLEPVIRSIEAGKPFLGICLGLQLLFEESDEFGTHRGMGVLPGRVTRFPEGIQDPETSQLYPIPHMGWNTVEIKRETPLFAGIENNSFFYFVHSYYPIPQSLDDIVAVTPYGIEFACAVQQGNIYAVQFHPEKSQEKGLRLLRNFGRIKD